MPGGRPKAFKSVEEIEEKIAEYKKYLLEYKRPASIAGLAYYLGVERQTIYNYEKDDKFFDTIKKHRAWALMNVEENCTIHGGGAVFIAKNYGYTDKQEIKHSGDMKVTLINDL